MWWFNAVIFLGKRKPLEVKDLYKLNVDDLSATLVPRWKKLWGKAISSYNSRLKEFEKGQAKFHHIKSAALKIDHSDEKRSSKSPLLDDDEPIFKSSPIPPPSIIWRILVLFKRDIFVATIVKCISDVLLFANPVVLKLLIAFTQDASIPIWHGALLAAAMFTASEISSLLLNQYYYLMYRVGTRIQTCLTAAVYQKVWIFV